jgi:YggT family protein
LILTWIPQTPQAIVSPLATIVDPALNLFRGVIPAIGGIDLSPILFFVLLDFMQSSAAALPCEMPKEGASAKAVAGGPRLPRRRAGRAVVVKRDR